MADVVISNDRFNEVFELMCDEYCMWPNQATSQETLNLHCEECPLNNIHIEEYWKARHKDD